MPFEQFEKSDALKKAEKEDAELAAKLSKKERIDFPGPATVSPEIAAEDLEILENRFTKTQKEPGKIVEFPEKVKPEEPKKAA